MTTFVACFFGILFCFWVRLRLRARTRWLADVANNGYDPTPRDLATLSSKGPVVRDIVPPREKRPLHRAYNMRHLPWNDPNPPPFG